MPFNEAYQINSREGEPTLKFNEALLYENNAMVEGGRLANEVAAKKDFIQKRLDDMQREVKGRLNMSDEEFKFALHVMEDELDASVPDNFREAYKAAKTPSEAANIISRGILEGLNQFLRYPTRTVTSQATGVERQIPIEGSQPRYDYIADKAAELGYISVDEADAKAMLQEINTTPSETGEAQMSISQDQIDRIWANYSKANGGSVTEATANGVFAMTNRGRDERIRKATQDK